MKFSVVLVGYEEFGSSNNSNGKTNQPLVKIGSNFSISAGRASKASGFPPARE
jgi:hypothetical protein